MLRLSLAVILIFAGWLPIGAAQAGEEFIQPYFGGVTDKWRAVQSRMRADSERLARCRADAEACSLAEKRLEAIVDAARVRDGRARIGEINRAVNLAIRPMSDMRRFGMLDLWTAPLDTMSAGAGDCEDYAILKFLALREAGIPIDDLRLVIVHDAMMRSDHAVVAARLAQRWVVLDNRGFALIDLARTRYRTIVSLALDGDRLAPRYADAIPSDRSLAL